MRKGDTIEIIKEGALHPGMRGVVVDIDGDGDVKAKFPAGTFKVDAGEYVHVAAEKGGTVEIVKRGALAVGARGLIHKVLDDGRIEAEFAEGGYTVDFGDYRVV